LRIAVIGPTGVLGRALVPILVQKGHIVRALARSTAKARRLFPQLREIVECDLLSDSAKDLPAMLDGCDAVVHIATSIHLNFTDADAMKANTRLRTDGTKLLLDASLKVGIRRYIQQSITMAYSNQSDN
jgi:nucleoside-diphosphate-sugar epimerase